MSNTSPPQELIQKKNRHLEEVHQSPNTKKQCKEAYNKVMDQIETLQVSHWKDPLEALPKEVWEEIIYGIISVDRYSSVPAVWGVNSLIELTSISKRWNFAIISTPGFWTDVEVDSNLDDLEAKVALCLNLSGASLIDLSIQLPCPAWAVVCPHIAKESYRIRSIFFLPVDLSSDFTSPWELETQIAVNAITHEIGDLPSLITLDSSAWMQYSPNVDNLLKRTGSVRNLGGILLSSETLGMESIKNIRSLRTTGSVTNFSPLLPTLACLENVAFSDSHSTGVFTIPNNAALRWKSFKCSQIITKGADTLFESFSSTIEEIRIFITWEMLSKFFPISYQMKGLRTVGLRLVSEGGDFDLTDSLYPSQVRHLALDLPVLWSPVDKGAGLGEPNHHRLVASFTIWAPLVEYLQMSGTDNPAYMIYMSYAGSLKHLKKLVIISISDIKHNLQDIYFPSVEEVHLSGSASLLSLGWYPAASRLTFDQGAQIPTPFEPARWNDLQVMTLNSHNIDWRGISLPHLKKLVHGHSDYSLRQKSSSIYVELAMRPTAFPSLSYVGAWRFPSWDILFIMLERRNFLKDGDVSPITTLALRRLPSQTILKPLIQYLRGCFPTNRASNFELSTHSIQDIYFDPTIAGCHECHMGFLYCKLGVGSYYIPENPLELSLPRYPETVDEVLATWYERETAWSQLTQSTGSFRQVSSGFVYRNKGLIEITGLTKSAE